VVASYKIKKIDQISPTGTTIMHCQVSLLFPLKQVKKKVVRSAQNQSQVSWFPDFLLKSSPVKNLGLDSLVS